MIYTVTADTTAPDGHAVRLRRRVEASSHREAAHQALDRRRDQGAAFLGCAVTVTSTAGRRAYVVESRWGVRVLDRCATNLTTRTS